MNDAHLHMLVNHFPIIGLFFGIAILSFGMFKRNALLINVAYIIFIFCMIMGKISMMTGDKAEHFIENMAGFSHELIEEHEETAEGFMKIMYLLGLTSALGLYVDYKKHKKALLFSFLVMTIAGVAIVLSGPVGTSGGEIRHSEIRSEPVSKAIENNSEQN
ncbi:MAG: hypothetical protein V4670_01600 [Bacteroidota bacterium]